MKRTAITAMLCLTAGLLLGMALRPDPTIAQSNRFSIDQVGRWGIDLRFDGDGIGQLSRSIRETATPVRNIARLSDSSFVVVGEKRVVVFKESDGKIVEAGSASLPDLR